MTADRRRSLLSSLDNAFLLLVAFYLLHMVETVSMLGWDMPRWGSLLLLLLMAAVAAARLLLLGLKDPRVWIAAGIGLVYAAVFFLSGYAQFLFFAVLTAGFVDMDYRKAIRVWLIAVGCAFLLVVSLCLAGKVEDLKFIKRGHLRHSMGFIYPTDFATLLLFLLLFLWVFWKKLPDGAALCFPVLTLLVAYFVAFSWTSMICGVLFLLIILIHMAMKGREKRRPMGEDKLRKGLGWLLAAATPLCILLSFWLLYAMGKGIPWVLRLDGLMSGRLTLSQNGYMTYGVHPFGSAFELIGNGATDGHPEGYNFIDNCYHLILVRYGWVLLLLLPLLWGRLILSAERGGDLRLALALALIAVHAISEHHLIEAHYTIPLVLPLAAFPREQGAPSLLGEKK